MNIRYPLYEGVYRILTIEGPGAEEFTTFYINGQKVNMSNGTVDLSAYNGKLDLKATSTYGGILKLTLNK